MRPSLDTGDIGLVSLDPTLGSEVQKNHPFLVVSPPEFNPRLKAVIAAPMTTGARAAAFRIPLTFQNKQSLILSGQIRTLDKARLRKKRGPCTPAPSIKTLRTLQAVFAPLA